MSDIEAPADPSATLSYRAAKLAVIVLSALIILALVGLVAGVILKMTGHSPHLLGKGGTGDIGTGSAAFVLPPGAKIVSLQSESGRLILRLQTGAGDEIDILDASDGHLIARIAPAKPPVPVR